MRARSSKGSCRKAIPGALRRLHGACSVELGQGDGGRGSSCGGDGGNDGGDRARATVRVSGAIPYVRGGRWRAGHGCGKVFLLVTTPTVVSVDAFVTPSAVVHRGSEVVYVGKTTPDPLIIDFDLILTAPRDLNIAGVGDILSIHTATYDWELAHKAVKSEYPFSPDDIDKARSILAEVMSKANDIAVVSDAGVESLVRAYIAVNTICLPAGHYRVEEGSEHYLVYALEKRLQ